MSSGARTERPEVAVLCGQDTTVAWPELPDSDGSPKVAGEVAGHGSLEQALTFKPSYDAHLVGYVAPDVTVETAHGPRIASSLRLRRGAESLIPGGYKMVLLIVDVDGPMHEHKAAMRSAKNSIEVARRSGEAASAEKLAGDLARLEERTAEAKAVHEAWWANTRAKIERLRADHPGIFAYRTGGGARLLGWIPPQTIACEADRDRWHDEYLIILGHLSLTYGILGDRGCSYVECLFRLPHVLRDGVRQEPECIGDPADVGSWDFSRVELETARAEVTRLWPKVKATGGGNGAAPRDKSDLAPSERWRSFTDEERTQRIALYREYLDGAPGSVPDGTASSTAFTVALHGVIGCGIESEIVLEMMIERWNPKCAHVDGRPYPWEERDLRRLVESASRSTKTIDFYLPEVRQAEREAWRATDDGRAWLAKKEAENLASTERLLEKLGLNRSTPAPAPTQPAPDPPTPAAESKLDRLRAMLDQQKPKLTLEEARAKIAKALREA